MIETAPNQRRRLGSNGPIVFPLALGCMGMSGMYGRVDERESIATIHAALDAGVTLLDTGDFYGAGHNELLIGRAIHDRRDKALISVKFGAMRGPDGRPSGVDARPAALKNFLSYSLTRLGVDHIDIYRPARLDPNVPIEETVGAIADLITAGFVRAIGLSEVGADTIQRAQKVRPISDLQIEYSLISRGPEQNLFPVVARLGIGVTAYGVLSRGLLSGSRPASRGDFRARLPRFSGDNLAHNRRLSGALRTVATDMGVSATQLAIAWVLAKRPDIVPVIGARTRAQLAESLGAVNVALTQPDMDASSALYPPVPSPERGTARTRCRCSTANGRPAHDQDVSDIKPSASGVRPATFSSTQPQALRQQLQVACSLPGDDGYDAARQIWTPKFVGANGQKSKANDHHPSDGRKGNTWLLIDSIVATVMTMTSAEQRDGTDRGSPNPPDAKTPSGFLTVDPGNSRRTGDGMCAFESRRRLLNLSIGYVEDLRGAGLHREKEPESVSSNFQVCLPYSGLFVLHVGDDDVVGDANQVVFVSPGDSFRMSGPIPEGYAQMIITPDPEVLGEITQLNRRALADHPAFKRRSRRAASSLQNFRTRFLHWVRGASAIDSLKAEELVLLLLLSALQDDKRATDPTGRPRCA